MRKVDNQYAADIQTWTAMRCFQSDEGQTRRTLAKRSTTMPRPPYRNSLFRPKWGIEYSIATCMMVSGATATTAAVEAAPAGRAAAMRSSLLLCWLRDLLLSKSKACQDTQPQRNSNIRLQLRLIRRECSQPSAVSTIHHNRHTQTPGLHKLWTAAASQRRLSRCSDVCPARAAWLMYATRG